MRKAASSSSMLRLGGAVVLVLWWLLSPLAGAAADAVEPLRYCNCGQTWQLAAPPQRMIALNQHAADLVLALGGDQRLVGVSWLDDDAVAARSGRYRGIPVISRHYPTLEAVLALESDFLVGGFASAFMPGRGPGTRDILAAEGIGSYLIEEACGPRRCTADPFAGVLHDLTVMGSLLGAEARAAELGAEFSARIEAVRRQPLAEALTVMVFDSDLRAPLVEGGRGFVNAMLALNGARNVFADLDAERASVSWEEVMARAPQVIVLIDATWSTAVAKRAFLESDPILAILPAVRNRHYIELRFSAAVPGVRSGAELGRLNRELHAIEAQVAAAEGP